MSEYTESLLRCNCTLTTTNTFLSNVPASRSHLLCIYHISIYHISINIIFSYFLWCSLFIFTINYNLKVSIIYFHFISIFISILYCNCWWWWILLLFSLLIFFIFILYIHHHCHYQMVHHHPYFHCQVHLIQLHVLHLCWNMQQINQFSFKLKFHNV